MSSELETKNRPVDELTPGAQSDLNMRRMFRAFGLTGTSAVFSVLVFDLYPSHTAGAVMDPGPSIYAGFCLALLAFGLASFIYAVRCVFVCRIYLPLRIAPFLLSLVLPTSLLYQRHNPPGQRRVQAEQTTWARVEEFQRLGEFVNPAIIDLFITEPDRFRFIGVAEQTEIRGLKAFLLRRPEIPTGLLRFSGDTLLDPWGSRIEIFVDRNHDQFLQTGRYEGHPIWHEKGVAQGAGLKMKLHPGVNTSSDYDWALKNSARP